MADLTESSALAPLVDAAVQVLESSGISTVVVSSGRSLLDERTAWDLLARSHCDGIILHSDHLTNEQLARLISTRRNVVLANLDHTRAGSLAATHLIEAGHTRMALVTGPVQRYSMQHVIDGFVQQINAGRGQAVELQTLEAPMSGEGGAIAMNLLLRSRITPTAVFLVDDRMAMGAMQVCQQNGIRVPDDVSLLGYGDREASAWTRPALSSIRIPAAAVGTRAAHRMLQMLDGVRFRQDPDAEASKDCKPGLIERDSVRNRAHASEEREQEAHISARERECLNWAAKGKTSWEISQILGVTESTIIYHLRNATRKLNAANRLHAVAKALKASIIDI